MPDLSSELLPRLKKHRLPGLNLGDDLIYPQYEGQSILNIPASVGQLLGAPGLEGTPLIPEILSPLGEGIRRVVMVLMDSLALHRLQRWIADGTTPVWGRLAQEGLLAPLTSTVPSTTNTALTTFWTGRSPAEHGIVGYEMWLKEYGVAANMILHRPITYRSGTDNLALAGFNPQTFLPVSTIGPHLAANGVEAHSFYHYSIIRSGLSRMLMPEVNLHSYGSLADLWISARELLEDRLDEKMFVWIYWSEVDGLSHRFGPDAQRPEADFTIFSQAMERLFLDQLSAPARRDTLLILTADHGGITTPKDPHYDLSSHPDLARRLHIKPTGENRLMYLHIKPGEVEAVREYFHRAWPDQFTILKPRKALETGLFGPGEPDPRLMDRLGDLIVITRGDAYLWWANKKNPLLGRHGGLSPEEMLVPFLAVRL